MQVAKIGRPDFDLEHIRGQLGDDWTQVNHVIREQLASDVVLINQVSHYIINSGGKRLRPLLVLLAARACGYAGPKHITAAAIIEFIHTATLLHDDVVDASELRRGHETANIVWGNQASVLVGDFLYSRAFQMMVEVGEMRVMEVMADATNTISEGEVLQLMNCNDPDTTEERYLQVIYRKTAKLFEAGAQLATILAGQPRDTERALREYGRQLGMAFQLIDDALDYGTASSELGKNVGDDLAEGKPTLPLIYAMAHGDAQQRQMIRQAIEHGGLEQIRPIREAIESTGALEYTTERARVAAVRAIASINGLPDSVFKHALVTIAEFAVNRRF